MVSGKVLPQVVLVIVDLLVAAPCLVLHVVQRTPLAAHLPLQFVMANLDSASTSLMLDIHRGSYLGLHLPVQLLGLNLPLV